MNILILSLQRAQNMVSRLRHLSIRVKDIIDVNKNHLTKSMLTLPQLQKEFKKANKDARHTGRVISVSPQDCYNDGVCPLAKRYLYVFYLLNKNLLNN